LSGVEICDEGLKAFILTKLFLCEEVLYIDRAVP
jgi:hypothetical protein